MANRQRRSSTAGRTGRARARKTGNGRGGRARSAGNGMSAIAVLERDHREAFAMMRRVEKDPGLFTHVKIALDVHARIEEEIFYPALRNTDEGRSPVREAQKEHQGVKLLLTKMAGLDGGSARFRQSLRQLQKEVQHHVAEERSEIFPMARQAFSREELAEMGRQLAQRRQELMQTVASLTSSLGGPAGVALASTVRRAVKAVLPG
jgi:iron-sulfur cluster repair protein YtfE (RIC family)